jgi:tRNA modification GTPase
VTDTIVALASGAVPSGVAVVRVSGPEAGRVLLALAGSRLPRPRTLVLRRILEPEAKELLDRALVAWFPGPQSFTGEDVAEFHVHGGPAVVGGVLEAALAVRCEDGRLACRLAGAGEFTRRAFDNDRLDLASVEGLADLVRAETEVQRRQALAGAGGAVRDQVERWRHRLTDALALLEAAIDFADEELPAGLEKGAAVAVDEVRHEIEAALANAAAGIRLREGFLIAIVGPPNVGKSSLLNAVAGREAAIVSSIPGTTRDIVEVSLDLGGYPVTLADTAGLREAADVIEAEGVSRARGLAERADATILVLDRRDWPSVPTALRGLAIGAGLVLWNKADLIGNFEQNVDEEMGLAVSSKTGYGLDRLSERLSALVRERLAGAETAIVTRRRHQEILAAALERLREWNQGMSPEVQAHLLHVVDRCFARMLGRADIEDVLDRIFAEFCIGK